MNDAQINFTITEFEKKYYLHDSGIDKVEYDAANKKLTLKIDFCFWMQRWYKAGELPNGFIAVTFENVSIFEYEYHDINAPLENLYTEIRTTKISDGTLFIIMWEYSAEIDEDIYPTMKIKAENVTVEEISRYE